MQLINLNIISVRFPSYCYATVRRPTLSAKLTFDWILSLRHQTAVILAYQLTSQLYSLQFFLSSFINSEIPFNLNIPCQLDLESNFNTFKSHPENFISSPIMANSHIPLFYRVFFLYIDPLICLSGIYLCFFDHATYLEMGVPQALTRHSPSPLSSYLITVIGAWSLSIFAMQILLLQQYRDVKVWKIFMFAILLTDLGMVYAVYEADPVMAVSVSKWGRGEWTNHGILGIVIAVRTAFLLGIGGVGQPS
jgi:hypothetical protein